MNDRLLEETAKLIDIVDTPLCSFVWKVCNHIQFENMRGTDFCNLMNLREPLPEIKIRKGESGRMCYMLCEVSKQIPNPDLASKWVGKMLKIFGTPVRRMVSSTRVLVAASVGRWSTISLMPR